MARQLRGLTTRCNALDAVLDLIATGGPRAVTFRAVADRSGVALGALSYHFPTRRELLGAAFHHHQERLRNSTDDLPLDAIDSLDTAARAEIVFAFLRRMATVDRLRHLAEFELALEMARDAEFRAEVEPTTNETHSLAVTLLTQVGAEHPEADATIFSAVMEGLLLGWIARPDSVEYENRVEAAISRMVEVFLPRPAAIG